MKKLYEFWTSDQSSGAIEITGDPTVRFGQLYESNAKLLYRKSFESYDEFRRFYEDFFFEGLKDRLPLINISATEFLMHEYPCALKAGDVLVLNSGFIQHLHGRTNDFMKKIGWRFSVVPGDKEFPWIIWIKAHKTDSQQIYFPIHEDNIHRFEKEMIS